MTDSQICIAIAGIGAFWCSTFTSGARSCHFNSHGKVEEFQGVNNHSHEVTHGEAHFSTTLVPSIFGATHTFLYSVYRLASRVHIERGDLQVCFFFFRY